MHDVLKTNALLALLIEIVIKTHDYEPMKEFKEKLKELMKEDDSS